MFIENMQTKHKYLPLKINIQDIKVFYKSELNITRDYINTPSTEISIKVSGKLKREDAGPRYNSLVRDTREFLKNWRCCD